MERITDLIPQDKSTKLAVLFAVIGLIVLPEILGAQWTKIITSTACFAIAIAGVSFLYGRVGMVSLTQVGLMGIGGWVMLRLSHGTTLHFEMNLIAAGLTAMAFGVVLALPALRLRGLYLALITLMAAGGFEILFSTFQFPNGGDGFWGVQTATQAGVRRPVVAQSDTGYLRFVIGVTIAAFVLIELNRRTKPGRAWAMIRQSEAAAMAISVNVTRHKIWAFALCGLLAGIAGALLAGSIGLLDPSTFRAGESILLFALAVVGGVGYWLGAIIAAVLYRILPAGLSDLGLDPDLAFVIFGAGLIHALITAPKGIAGQILGEPTAAVAAAKSTGIAISDVSVRFGGVVALDALTVQFNDPIVGIIGPNGAGKTTLMNSLSGFVPCSGSITSGTDDLLKMPPHLRSAWGLRRSFQREELSDDLSVWNNILVQLDGTNAAAADKSDMILAALTFAGIADKAHTSVAQLDGFDRRLVDIAKCVVGHPRAIMLDEPAGGLSSDETEKLGTLILKIHDFCGAQTLLIDHDVDLVTRVCTQTLVLDFGKKIDFGPTKTVLEDPAVVAAYLGKGED